MGCVLYYFCMSKLNYLKKITYVFLALFNCQIAFAEQTIETIFGPLSIDGALEKIYQLPKMQRLKGMQQFGSMSYWTGIKGFSRIELSGDVLFLLIRFGASMQEQIAGLVHNISEPVFSQTSDVVFGKKNYTQSIYEWYLSESDIETYLKKYDWEAKDILPNSPEFKRLNQPYPEMCAINIAFYVRAGVKFGMIKAKDVKNILANLRYDTEKNRWFFAKKAPARKLAHLALIFSEHVFCANDNRVLYHITGLILKRAMAVKRITKEDLLFKTDEDILQKINECDDLKLKKLIAKAKHIKKAYRVLDDDESSPDFVPKDTFKGIDPWIYNKHSKTYQRLTELDTEFADEYEKIKTLCAKGAKIQLLLTS
jgi:HD superfamily phosphohydrolase